MFINKLFTTTLTVFSFYNIIYNVQAVEKDAFLIKVTEYIDTKTYTKQDTKDIRLIGSVEDFKKGLAEITVKSEYYSTLTGPNIYYLSTGRERVYLLTEVKKIDSELKYTSETFIDILKNCTDNLNYSIHASILDRYDARVPILYLWDKTSGENKQIAKICLKIVGVKDQNFKYGNFLRNDFIQSDVKEFRMLFPSSLIPNVIKSGK